MIRSAYGCNTNVLGGNEHEHNCLHAWETMKVPPARPRKMNTTEAVSELPGPRGIIVGSLCQSTNQRLAVNCEGDFPFPFQSSDHYYESEVKSRMQAINFYCKLCKKSMKLGYVLTGDDNNQVMNGVIIRCHTHKCNRVLILKNYTEDKIRSEADASGKCFI